MIVFIHSFVTWLDKINCTELKGNVRSLVVLFNFVNSFSTRQQLYGCLSLV